MVTSCPKEEVLKVFGVIDVLEVVGASLPEGCAVDDPSLANNDPESYFLREDLTQLAHECELAQKLVHGSFLYWTRHISS